MRVLGKPRLWCALPGVVCGHGRYPCEAVYDGLRKGFEVSGC